MRSPSHALGCILLCLGLTVAAGCSGGSDDPEESGSAQTTTSTTEASAPAPPDLATDTDDVEAAMRSLLEFAFWSETEPGNALDRMGEWLVLGGPFEERMRDALSDQVEKKLRAGGHPEILEVTVERQEAADATVLVWMQSLGYPFVGPAEHAFESPAFARTLFVFELSRGSDGSWRILDRRIPEQ